MKRMGPVVAMVGVVGLAVGLVALRARSQEVGEAETAAAGEPGRGAESEEAERRALAARANLRVEDLVSRSSGPEGVTREDFEASLRRRAESLDPAVARAEAAALRQRLEWAAEYADGQRREAARRVLSGGIAPPEPASSAGTAMESAGARVPADSADCRPYCEFLQRCNGAEEPGDWAGCLAACGRGEFGIPSRLRNVVALGDCEHP